MSRRARGTFLGVAAGWQDRWPVDQAALMQAFDSMRDDAVQAGCACFPTREDCAAHPLLFNELYNRYSQRTNEQSDRDAFRRHVLTVHKDGGTPE